MLIERFTLWLVTQLSKFIEAIANSIEDWALEVC